MSGLKRLLHVFLGHDVKDEDEILAERTENRRVFLCSCGEKVYYRKELGW